jgi:AcrR family transcriptional regulator
VILEAAAQVFERHGYAAGTTNRIAERAGVSVGSVYQYFPNKDAILVALVEQHIAEGQARLVPLLAELIERPAPIAEGLARLLGEMADIHRAQPGLHRVLFEEAPRPPALKAHLDELQRAAVAAIAYYLEQCGEVRVDDLHTAARLIVTVIESVTHNLAIDTDNETEWQTIAASTVAMLCGLLTADGAAA